MAKQTYQRKGAQEHTYRIEYSNCHDFGFSRISDICIIKFQDRSRPLIM